MFSDESRISETCEMDYKNHTDNSFIDYYMLFSCSCHHDSILIPDSQEVTVIIDEVGTIKIQGSSNASIFRGERAGTYTIEGGNIMMLDMGEDEKWTCSYVFTKDGLLRLTVPEMEVVLYLQRKGGI